MIKSMHSRENLLGMIDMFSELVEFMKENELSVNIVKKSVTTHLQTTMKHFNREFPEETALEQYDWIRSQFTVTSADHLTPDMEDTLVELSSDQTLKTVFNPKTMAEFWILVKREYPQGIGWMY